MNANSGYSGWSMSKNAARAYADGEMPNSICVPTKTGHGRHVQAYYDGEMKATAYGAAAQLLKDIISSHDADPMSIDSISNMYLGLPEDDPMSRPSQEKSQYQEL